MTDVHIGPMDCVFAGFGRKNRCRGLRPQLDVQLSRKSLALINCGLSGELHTSTQSSSSTLPLASTLTCFKVSRARSYDSPFACKTCRTSALSIRPGESVLIALESRQILRPPTLFVSVETHLKRLMRSNISSCETSGYFLRKRSASMVYDEG